MHRIEAPRAGNGKPLVKQGNAEAAHQARFFRGRQEEETTMSATAKHFLVGGAVLAALAVVSGAFGAHALRGVLTPAQQAIYQTAVHYHFLHALGLLAVALTLLHWPAQRLLRWAGWCMGIGVALFSGSLYALSLSGIGWLGAVTPLGGLAFIAGWLLLALAAWRA